MIQSSQQIWSPWICQVCLNPVLQSRQAPARPKTTDQPGKLDSYNFDYEAGDQTGGLSESCTHLKVSITFELYGYSCRMIAQLLFILETEVIRRFDSDRKKPRIWWHALQEGLKSRVWRMKFRQKTNSLMVLKNDWTWKYAVCIGRTGP